MDAATAHWNLLHPCHQTEHQNEHQFDYQTHLIEIARSSNHRCPRHDHSVDIRFWSLHNLPNRTWNKLSENVGSPPASNLEPPVVRSTLLIELLSLSARYMDFISGPILLRRQKIVLNHFTTEPSVVLFDRTLTQKAISSIKIITFKWNVFVSIKEHVMHLPWKLRDILRPFEFSMDFQKTMQFGREGLNPVHTWSTERNNWT